MRKYRLGERGQLFGGGLLSDSCPLEPYISIKMKNIIDGEFSDNESLNEIVENVVSMLIDIVENIISNAELASFKPICFALVTGHVEEEIYDELKESDLEEAPEHLMTIGIHAFPIFKDENGDDLNLGLEKTLLSRALKKVESNQYKPKDKIVYPNKKATVH